MTIPLRILRDRICLLINNVIDFDHIEQMNPMLALDTTDVQCKVINERLEALGYRAVFGADLEKCNISEQGYPSKPNIVIAFHILYQIFSGHLVSLRDLDNGDAGM